MKSIVKRAVAERLGGGRPSVPRAIVAAVVVGAVTAGVTYKALRG
jgi:hypothetical protein